MGPISCTLLSHNEILRKEALLEISKLYSQPHCAGGTGVAVAAPEITLTNNASSVAGSVPVVSAVEIGTASASLTNGIAAAQKWTQTSGTTGTPQ